MVTSGCKLGSRAFDMYQSILKDVILNFRPCEYNRPYFGRYSNKILFGPFLGRWRQFLATAKRSQRRTMWKLWKLSTRWQFYCKATPTASSECRITVRIFILAGDQIIQHKSLKNDKIRLGESRRSSGQPKTASAANPSYLHLKKGAWTSNRFPMGSIKDWWWDVNQIDTTVIQGWIESVRPPSWGLERRAFSPFIIREWASVAVSCISSIWRGSACG